MRLRILGTAAGGGYPQWNCSCQLCGFVRSNQAGARPRSHASLALNGRGSNWYLVNATPDVRFQIESFPPLHPRPALRADSSLRETPIRGVLLTDAELDHTLGLLSLREGTPLDIYATAAVLSALADGFPIRRMIRSYAPFRWLEVKPREAFRLDGGRLRAQAFGLGQKKPRYAVNSQIEGHWVVGYRFEDVQTGGVAVYAPAIEHWTDELESELADANCLLVDGTFWTDDELIRLELGERTAREMGHVPVSGTFGSAEHLATLGAKRKIYVHINNTNPALDEHSAECRYLAERGIEVGWDGMDLEV